MKEDNRTKQESSVDSSVPRRWPSPVRAAARALLALFGWRIVGKVPHEPKLLLVGAPHESNWDYLLTLAAMMAKGVDLHYVAKKALFANPLGFLFRWLGGVSLDRQSTAGFVNLMVAEFAKTEKYLLAIMPEGTRGKVKAWRSGFYYIALGAGVPILLITFDYRARALRLGPLFRPTGDYERDLADIQSHLVGIGGKHSHKAYQDAPSVDL